MSQGYPRDGRSHKCVCAFTLSIARARLLVTAIFAGRKTAGVGGKRDRPAADSDEEEDEEDEDGDDGAGRSSSSAAAAVVKKPRKAASSGGGGGRSSSGGAGNDGGGTESERMLRLQREIEGLQAQVRERQHKQTGHIL